MPLKCRNNVVLPQPFAPKRAIRRPCGSVRERSRRATVPSGYANVTPSTASTGGTALVAVATDLCAASLPSLRPTATNSSGSLQAGGECNVG